MSYSVSGKQYITVAAGTALFAFALRRMQWRETACLTSIASPAALMGGNPCVRGTRVTVGTLVGLVAAGHPFHEVLAAYPYLEDEDIRQAPAYAAWRVEEIEVPLRQAFALP